jgi:3-deoxy-D-manno-octulosonate cytidylyltransferase
MDCFKAMDTEKKRILAIIPARWASSRFPGKPLAKIRGKEMILWVAKRVETSNLFDRVVIATDSRQIYVVAKAEGYTAIMTSEDCSCGTERCKEVLTILEESGEKYDVVVNVQGDEPLISRTQLQQVLLPMREDKTQIATLCKVIEDEQTLLSPDNVKVVMNHNGEAIYFSRSVVPYNRETTLEYGIAKGYYYKHLGLYAYRAQVLKEIVDLYPSELEKIECLEQLRWIENRYTIKVGITTDDSVGVDSPQDLQKVEEILNRQI